MSMNLNIYAINFYVCLQCNTQELCCQLSVHSGYSFQRPRCLQGMQQVNLYNISLNKNIVHRTSVKCTCIQRKCLDNN